MSKPSSLAALDGIITTIVAPSALEIDRRGEFPRAAITALGECGLLGLTSSIEVGGLGSSLAEASQVVRRLAASCGSTAMVLSMHYCATAVIEHCGPVVTRRAIAAGKHLSTLAFSETGSRSHFWAPLGTASVDSKSAVLNAEKSWITSAGEANSYVWTSKPATAAGAASLWLVPAETAGLTVGAAFDGLGLRGNASSPVTASSVVIPLANRLGEDGAGLDLALGVVLPVFQILNASCSLGLMDAAVAKAIGHLSSARLVHLNQALADQPVLRQHLARIKNLADAADTLVQDAIEALASNREDAPLRMLQSKAVAAETASQVVDLAMRLGGGAAFRKDIGIERHFRDARAATVMAPTSDALQEFIGRALCGLPLFD